MKSNLRQKGYSPIFIVLGVFALIVFAVAGLAIIALMGKNLSKSSDGKSKVKVCPHSFKSESLT